MDRAAIRRLFIEMEEAIDSGGWNRDTFNRLKDEARHAAPDNPAAAAFLFEQAASDWLEPDDIQIEGPILSLDSATVWPT